MRKEISLIVAAILFFSSNAIAAEWSLEAGQEDWILQEADSSYARDYRICNQGPGEVELGGSITTVTLAVGECVTVRVWRAFVRSIDPHNESRGTINPM